MIDRSALADALRGYLPRQRWFGRGDRDIAEVIVTRIEVLERGWPALTQVVADVTFDDGERASYHVLVGLRPPGQREDFLDGKPHTVLGELPTDQGAAYAYDATVDPELALRLLHHVLPDERAERARPVTSEQSNSSIVYDERLILKVFRRLADGPNPDAESTRALVSVGFDHVAPPVAEWSVDGVDYAVVNEFLVGAADGFHLAVTSLRDLYDRRGAPSQAGGDFAPDATRLGAITATMHVALARAFGLEEADVRRWAAEMQAQLDRVSAPGLDRERAAEVFERVARLEEPGPAIRVHGDYHLGQVMRSDAGWFILDFEGEPSRPLEERRRPSSPFKDVAGMLRSLHYAAEVARRERAEDHDVELEVLARRWEEHNGLAFLDGYLSTDGVDEVLPAGDATRTALLDAFLLDKAVYEVGYEQAHRPDWIEIPLSAVARLLGDQQ